MMNFTETVHGMVDDIFEFQKSELGERLKLDGSPAWYGKYIRLQTHRRAGLTTAALSLMETYTSGLYITHSHASAQYILHFAYDNNLAPTWTESIRRGGKDNLHEYITPEWRIDDHWFDGKFRGNERYQLIVIDPASMVEYKRNEKERHGIDQLREKLMMICDVLVELG